MLKPRDIKIVKANAMVAFAAWNQLIGSISSREMSPAVIQAADKSAAHWDDALKLLKAGDSNRAIEHLHAAICIARGPWRLISAGAAGDLAIDTINAAEQREHRRNMIADGFWTDRD